MVQLLQISILTPFIESAMYTYTTGRSRRPLIEERSTYLLDYQVSREWTGGRLSFDQVTSE